MNLLNRMRNPCPARSLADLHETLAVIRSWPGIEEVAPGVFNYHGWPFLHFRLGEAGKRWANIRHGVRWGTPLALHLDADAEDRKFFLREVRDRYYFTTAAFTHRAMAA